MIISPPFLPSTGLRPADPTVVDPMMDVVDTYEQAHGIYPIAFDRRWHCGVHLMPAMQNEKVHAIADGVVVAYRVCQHAYDGGGRGERDSHAGFVLLRHTTETGDGRTLTFYSLYMHLLDLASYQSVSADAKHLPEFLRMPTAGDGSAVPPAQPGDGRRVNRKDVLGWMGECQGMRHLHFEIFMTKSDFDAYFGQTRLGDTSTDTATGVDCWGHSYYMIPANRTFVSLPPGIDAHQRLHGIPFDALQTGRNTQELIVETYFHKGSRYTNAWSMAADGKRTLLTEKPVVEKDYEYDMYRRAAALYPACPSDGYELLRFGRILAKPETLDAGDARATWMRVPYAPGAQGYIDVSKDDVVKLSDADFPFFMGWRKISEGDSPFSADGLCDIDELKKLVSDTTDHHARYETAKGGERKSEDNAMRYIRGNDRVRRQLRGFVCEAPSEWDSSHNEQRYRKLKDEGEFYHGNETGYKQFMDLLTSFQFWNATGLPSGQKLWFFHPLEFIRHFRKCGWLSAEELLAMFPSIALRSLGKGRWTAERVLPSRGMAANFAPELNRAMHKFGVTTPLRRAAFLGNAMQETQWFSSLVERTSSPPPRYSPWIGRGFLQLTWPENYVEYWRFSGRRIDQELVDRLHLARLAAETAHNNEPLIAMEAALPENLKAMREAVGRDVKDAASSAGAYWVWSGAARYADAYPVLRPQTRFAGSTYVPYYSCESFAKVAATVNVGHPSTSFSTIYGIEARFHAYASVLMASTDLTELDKLVSE
ncbi:M23 family metallopeptidase [Paraburkholderia humisilvae]|uniref:Peptidase M23 domain-containing protein n=1 Tax=Paraburkholderia humisilvae TaxID=627669 RepID=A0A6J5ENZ9_9BURK|nr:M23 family metallopeptidase [Paraburkholderia humisilvae]CAB3768260.1 hypothetical protein LMG29542_05823 [Paraburkholderia humisilvae]